MTDRLEEIRQRVEKATPAGWRRQSTYDDQQIVAGFPERNQRVVATAWRDDTIDPETQRANAAFIAHAREDIPWLLAEVERLSRENVTLGRMVTDECELRDRGVADLAAARERMQELEKRVGYWEGEARRRSGDVDFWKGKVAALAKAAVFAAQLNDGGRKDCGHLLTESCHSGCFVLREGESKT